MLRPKLFLSIVALLTTIALAGCATIFSGTRQNVTINSNPSGALILVDGLEMGRTPATVPLNRAGLGGSPTVTLRMEGYEDRSFALQSTFNAVSIINVFFWPGFIVDAVSGAITRYSPTAYSVTMQRSRVGMADDLGVDHVVLIGELESDANGVFIIPAGLAGIKIAVVDPVSKHALVLR